VRRFRQFVFLDESDWETHKILAAVGLNSTLSRLKEGEYAPRGAFFRSAADMERLFPRHHGAIAETERIADRCSAELDIGKWIMPRIEVPQGFTPESWLRTLAVQGLEANYAGKNSYEKASGIRKWNGGDESGHASIYCKRRERLAARTLSGGWDQRFHHPAGCR
jgi:DNA polymerase III alpha subunit